MSFYREEDIERQDKIVRDKYTVDCQKAIEDGEEVRVEQHHKDAQNINNIVKSYAGDAELIEKNKEIIAFNMDDIPTNDFAEMQNILVAAKQAFESVPSHIRAQFEHDPAKYVDFVRNPDNAEKLVEMGLATAPEQEPDPVPVQVQIVDPDPTPTT